MSTNVEKDFIQVQNEIREDYKIRKTISPIVNVLRSRPTKGILLLFCFSVVVPILIYYFIIDKGTEQYASNDTCAVNKTYRIQCGKAENATFDTCNKISCCFDNSTKRCFHYLPSKYYYYNDGSSYISSLTKTPFLKEQTNSVHLSIYKKSEKSVQIVLSDNNNDNSGEFSCVNTTDYICTISSHPLFVEFHRNGSGDLLLTTAKGPLILSENYWEWSVQLTEEYLFGLGETLIDIDENSTLTKVIYGNDKDHNTLPNFLAYTNGNYHGLVIRHGGPLEITIHPSKLISLKSLSGKEVTLELSVGPTINDVIMQQNENSTNSESTVNIDTLKVHICREGSSMKLEEILDDYNNEVDKLNGIQYVTDCLHENLLLAALIEDNNDNIDLMNTLIREKITTDSHRFALSILPQVSYNSSFYLDTENSDIYYKINATTNYKGRYFNHEVLYPYFNHPNIDSLVSYLLNRTNQIFESLPEDFILGRNWPSDNSFEMEETDDFQYLSKELMEAMSFTLPWNVFSDDKLQYLDHNNYGYFHVNKISAALKEMKPSSDLQIMTASPTFGRFQPIIIQNVDISWTNFKKSITTILSNSLFGHFLTSIPVCGSTDSFTALHESLCVRWYLMASTAPIFRISSDIPRRYPSSLNSTYAVDKTKEAIEFRYSLLYYFYTVLSNNEPIMRPMVYDFPYDKTTFPLVDQYMVGADLLVVHPTLPDQTQIKVYLPRNVSWFEFWGGAVYGYDSGQDGWITLTTTETDWIGFVREGVIVPLIVGENNGITEVKLKITLKCTDENCVAEGTMAVGNSKHINFISTKNDLTLVNEGEDGSFVLSEVEIFEANNTPRYLKSIGSVNLVDNITCSYSDTSLICQ